jgi:hypothetical protein
MLTMGCSNPGSSDKPAVKSDEECISQKQEIQKVFDRKDFNKTIELFIPFRDCYQDEVAYLNKLGLLYHANHQDSLGNQIFGQLLKKLDNEKSMSGNDIAFSKAIIYMMLEEQDNLKAEIEKIDRSNLTKSQEHDLQYLELFAHQGEFITASMKMEFELFD